MRPLPPVRRAQQVRLASMRVHTASSAARSRHGASRIRSQTAGAAACSSIASLLSLGWLLGLHSWGLRFLPVVARSLQQVTLTIADWASGTQDIFLRELMPQGVVFVCLASVPGPPTGHYLTVRCRCGLHVHPKRLSVGAVAVGTAARQQMRGP
jgi:hypothetical protein